MKRIKNWLCRALGCEKKPKPPKQQVIFTYRIGLAVNKTKGPQMLELTITNEQEVTVTLAPKTLAGKPAELDDPPQWSVISGDSQVVPAEDGMSARLVSSDTPGDTQFLVKGDADLGEGTEEISDTIKLTVQGARAANLGLTAGEPVPKQPV